MMKAELEVGQCREQENKWEKEKAGSRDQTRGKYNLGRELMKTQETAMPERIRKNIFMEDILKREVVGTQ